MTQKRILVIDDEQDIRNLLCISLERMGYTAIPGANCKEACSLISNNQFDLALTDIRLPDGNGMSLISKFKTSNPNSPIAVMTAFDTTDIAVDAMKKGAFDFLSKPIRQQRLQALIEDALSQGTTPDLDDGESLITGNAQSIIDLRKMIIKVAQTQAPVLITGESGTGKELVAQSIHQKSHRHDKPFIPVNCGAIPGELMESEFFGHQKGSFTGANADKEGLFQAAEGGTLFLDEVADLPVAMQVKLLRAVQEKAIRPVGAQAEILTNVRILSATHKDLSAEISVGNFRQDLYYRLNVIDIRMPALRDRKEDIDMICRTILTKLDAQQTQLRLDVIKHLESYSFPGNIRELENILQRAIALCDTNDISVDDINTHEPSSTIETTDKEFDVPSLQITNLEDYLAQLEKQIICDVLEAECWNRGRTADRLRLTQRQLRYKLNKHRLSIDQS